jgi:hypothetical protein
VGNDGIGPNYGVARGAGLISIQVFTRFNSSGSCGGQAPCTLSYPSDQIRAMERVLVLSETYDVASVNLSLGGGRYYDEASCDAAQPSRKAAIDNLRGAGIVVAAASGNNGYRDSMNAPACISSAVAVGATTDTDLVSGFSNIAGFVDLLAPGSSITSSVPGDGTATWSGTSMATPHVAGAWAVMQQFSPGGSVDAFLAVLRNSSEIVNDLRSGGTVTDMRRFNLDLALDVLGAPAPEFESDPEAEELFDFGDVTVGAGSIDSTITVSNTGDADLTLSCALSGANAGSFTIGQCPEPIAPATEMDVKFSCTPISGGTLVASLDFTTNDIDETLVSFTLNCNGLGPEFVSAPPAAAVFDFDVVEIDSISPELTLQIDNIGTANLNLNCALGPDDPGSFSVSPCPASLGPGGNVILDLSCQPTTLGNLSASLDLTTNDFDEGSVSYSLVCDSVAPPAPEFESVPAPDSVFDFEDVDVGATSDMAELQVSNLGGADMTVSCDISGDDADQFSLVQCPNTVASQENITVSFSCDPTSFGSKSASLDLTTNDADETDVSYGLLCNGLAPEFESSPPGGAVIDFGDVVVGADGIYFQLDVDNLGTAGLTLACVLSGADTDAFDVNQCPPSVDPQSSVEITLICEPPDIGEKAASLDLTTNDEDEGSVSYDLACRGIDDLLSRNGFETTE